jgi:dCMP deaminase
MPCSNCGAVIVQAGIKRVVTLENNNERWLESFEITRQIFAEAGIELVIRPALD